MFFTHVSLPFLTHHPDISDDGSTDQVRSVFQTKQGRKTIDIYWISDDGGEIYDCLNVT